MEYKVATNSPQRIAKIANTYWCLLYVRKVPSPIRTLILINPYKLWGRCCYYSHFIIQKKLNYKKIQKHVQGQTSNKRQSRDFNPGILAQKSTQPQSILPINCCRMTKSVFSKSLSKRAWTLSQRYGFESCVYYFLWCYGKVILS